MPELPEVETIRRSLQKALVGRKITGVEVLDRKSFIGGIREIGEIRGRRVRGVERRGKMLVISLSDNKNLLVHLKLTGRLLVRKPDDPADDWVRVVVSLSGGKELRFCDLRKFGWMKIVSDLREVGEIGVEPLDKEFTLEYLRQVFGKTSRPVKVVLMDQTKIAGIGNIYANEALFEAGISPLKAAKKLRNLEIKKLREGIIRVLEEGLRYGGASAADEAYVKPNGTPGKYQEYFRVYQRENQRCLKCGTLIERMNLAGRGTFFCPGCQRQ